MKTLSLLFVFSGMLFSAAAQQYKVKAAGKKSSLHTSGTKPTRAKQAEGKKIEFDQNFRGYEQRVRHSIYTLGGRLTPAGKKPGEGC